MSRNKRSKVTYFGVETWRKMCAPDEPPRRSPRSLNRKKTNREQDHAPSRTNELEPHSLPPKTLHMGNAETSKTRTNLARRVSPSRPRDVPFQIVSHNIRGTQGAFELNGDTRDLGKLETIALNLSNRKWKVDIYLVQETWITGDWIIEAHGCTIIHHGPPPKKHVLEDQEV